MKNKFRLAVLFRLFVFCGIIPMFYACMDDRGRIEVKEIENGEWARNTPVYVYYTNNDTASAKTLYVIARHRTTYGYDRLDIGIETLTPDGIFWRDTVAIRCGNSAGNALQNDSKIHSDILADYRSNVRLSQPGIYRFRFSQLMPDSVLSGIVGVGIEVK